MKTRNALIGLILIAVGLWVFNWLLGSAPTPEFCQVYEGKCGIFAGEMLFPVITIIVGGVIAISDW